jgi:hypothetical protein
MTTKVKQMPMTRKERIRRSKAGEFVVCECCPSEGCLPGHWRGPRCEEWATRPLATSESALWDEFDGPPPWP